MVWGARDPAGRYEIVHVGRDCYTQKIINPWPHLPESGSTEWSLALAAKPLRGATAQATPLRCSALLQQLRCSPHVLLLQSGPRRGTVTQSDARVAQCCAGRGEGGKTSPHSPVRGDRLSTMWTVILESLSEKVIHFFRRLRRAWRHFLAGPWWPIAVMALLSLGVTVVAQ